MKKKAFNLKKYKIAMGLEEGEHSNRVDTLDYAVHRIDPHFYAHTIIDIDGQQRKGDIIPMGEYGIIGSPDWQSRILENLKTKIQYVIYSDVLRKAINKGTIMELNEEEE